MNRVPTLILSLAIAVGTASLLQPAPASAASASQIDSKATAALNDLYASTPGAREIGAKARAILIFPSIIKAGFIFGGAYGEGSLREGGKTVGYYSSVAASYGLQAGGQTFGYVMFLMTDSALHYLKDSKGWEVGVGPSVVVVDAGKAKSLTTTTMQDDVYAFIFDQKGLMAGLGVQGSKITKIRR